MSVVETISDVTNPLLSRRELTCSFAGLGGRLNRLESVEMVTRQYSLDGKTIIPIRLQNQVGLTTMTGLFYVYDDEALARRHINPAVFSRLEKSRAKAAEAESAAADATKAGQSAEGTS